MERQEKQTHALAGVAAILIGVAVVVHVAKKRKKRRRSRVLPKGVRKTMTQIVQSRGEDLVTMSDRSEALLMNRIDKLDDKRLLALVALVQVGHFVKKTGIDPLHPNSEDIKRAAKEYVAAELAAPKSRFDLVGKLKEADPAEVRDALGAGYGVLSHA